MQITGCPSRGIFAGFAAGAFFIAGCGQAPSNRVDAKLPESGAAQADGMASGPAKIERTSGKLPSAVDLRAVKYDQLRAAIKAQRGHVVVMDVWAEY
jgi:hypothetical protein